MNQKSAHGKILPCPGLKITANAGVSWTDRENRVHDLITTRLLKVEEVAASPLMSDIGFGTVDSIYALVNSGRLYPAFRKNSRFVRVYECALRDFRVRFVAGVTTPRAAKVA